MLKTILRVSVLFVLSILLIIQSSTSSEQKSRIQSIHAKFCNQEAYQNLNLNPNFGKIPLYFISNEGQVDETASFYAKSLSYTLWLTKEGLVFDRTRRIKKERTEPKRPSPREMNDPEDFSYDRNVSRLVFLNANSNPEVIPVDNTEHKMNYFIGNDESKWQTNIQTSRAVSYRELYPNTDLEVYGLEKQIEYDFVVKPGGQVSDIAFEYRDVEKTRIDDEGNLVVETEFGDIKHAKPICYQVIGGERVEIQAEFMRKEENTYGFQVKEYDKNYELIIDPLVLVYSTYLGGSLADSARSIAVDSTGSIYVAGFTGSMNFPTKNSVQESKAGGGNDVFITKINASGTDLVYSTYLGGSADEGRCETGIAVDPEGAAYVTGWTSSLDFPTRNPIQKGNAGGTRDGFVTKISASGSAIVYSTYLGGSNWDQPSGIAVDSEGAAYVAGCTISYNFPTKNPIQGSLAGLYDAFITKINPAGNELIYSTYLGGSGVDGAYFGLAIDPEGAAYLTGYTDSINFPTQDPIQGTNAGGYDVFITKINSAGNKLIYSTYLGGSGEDYYGGIAVDLEGAAYVTGNTGSVDFPTKNSIQGSKEGEFHNAFITKINAWGTALVYSTYLGGSGGAGGDCIAVDSEGAAYVAGTAGVDFPTKNPIQGTNAGQTDIFIAKVNSSGSDLIYSTYLGGGEEENSEGIAVDSEGAAYVTGFTRSDDFITLNHIQGIYGGGERDAVIAKLYFTFHSVPSLTITAGSGGTSDPSPGTYTYIEGTKATIRAIPNSGYIFSGWSGDASGTANPIAITMDSDKSVTAYFTKDPNFAPSLTITAGSGGTTNPSPGNYTYDKGTEVTIRAIPNSGYTFSGWSGDASGTTNPITIAMDLNKSITANFAKTQSDGDGKDKGGACFIATACYGTPMAEEVKTLCAFRDQYFLTNPIGRALVKIYYSNSSRIADFIRDKEYLKAGIRECLKPVIKIMGQIVK